MSMNRPLFSFSTAQLQEQAKSHWNTIAELRKVLEELSNRTTPKAKRLERDINARIAELTGPPTAAKGNPSATRDEALMRAELRALMAENKVIGLEVKLSTLQ